MSIRHINASLHLELKDAACKAVLLGLSNHADPDTSECFPSNELLSIYSGMTERTVRDAIRRLERLKLVVTKPRPGTSSIYWLDLELMEKMRHERFAEPRQMTRRPRQMPPPTPAAVAPEPLRNHKETTTRARDPLRQVPEDWKPSAQLLEWADARYPAIDIEAQVEPFIRYNRKMASPVSNIEEAFKGWLGRTTELARPVPARRAKLAADAPPIDPIKAMQERIQLYLRMGRTHEVETDLQPRLDRMIAAKQET